MAVTFDAPTGGVRSFVRSDDNGCAGAAGDTKRRPQSTTLPFRAARSPSPSLPPLIIPASSEQRLPFAGNRKVSSVLAWRMLPAHALVGGASLVPPSVHPSIRPPARLGYGQPVDVITKFRSPARSSAGIAGDAVATRPAALTQPLAQSGWAPSSLPLFLYRPLTE